MQGDYRTFSYISTNTLLAEGDKDTSRAGTYHNKFQPTPSSRRVTSQNGLALFVVGISTNTLLAEGDPTMTRSSIRRLRFQPTPSSRRVTACLCGRVPQK